MPLRPSAASLLTGPIAAGLLAAAAPALSQPQAIRSSSPAPAIDAAGSVYGDAAVDQRPEWRDKAGGVSAPPRPMAPAVYDQAAWENARADWLAECRRRRGARTPGTVVGTVVGGVTGGVAGGAIGRSADQRRNADYCESYLDRYTSPVQLSYSAQGYVTNGARFTFQPMIVMVPVMQQPIAAAAGSRGYTETIVTEEWVPLSTPRRRAIPAPRPQPDKRVPLR